MPATVEQERLASTRWAHDSKASPSTGKPWQKTSIWTVGAEQNFSIAKQPRMRLYEHIGPNSDGEIGPEDTSLHASHLDYTELRAHDAI